MILEFCAENFTKIPEAIKGGASRIELCDNLAAGGTTPAYGVIKQAVAYAQAHGAAVMTMIRPRGGNFVYNAVEIERMKTDLEMAKALKSQGVVFGCLTSADRVAREPMKELMALCEDMEIVFHMAFDEIAREHAKEEMDWLIEQGVTRILTHGGLEGTVLDNVDWLNELIEHANGRIEILVGGGVTFENIAAIQKALPVTQFHGTRIVDFKE